MQTVRKRGAQLSTQILHQKQIIIMALNAFTKSKASTLAKIAALPRFRHPMDLLNEPHLPYDLQVKQMDATLTFKEGQYLSHEHYQLCKSSASLRTQYRESQEVETRQQIAVKHFNIWDRYLSYWLSRPEVKLTQEQQQRVYQAMLTAKERNEQRLSLCRFIKFGYEYSQAFKMDIPLNPIVVMKMVHPHFGYLNNIPNLNQFKYSHEELFEFIEQFVAASELREKGYTLHSMELFSFIFWKTLTQNNARVNTKQFLQLMKIFKFNKLTEDNYQSELSYSLHKGQLIQQDKAVRFEVLRQIFIDRDL